MHFCVKSGHFLGRLESGFHLSVMGSNLFLRRFKDAIKKKRVNQIEKVPRGCPKWILNTLTVFFHKLARNADARRNIEPPREPWGPPLGPLGCPGALPGRPGAIPGCPGVGLGSPAHENQNKSLIMFTDALQCARLFSTCIETIFI